MPEGRVKFFRQTWGYIAPDDGAPDVFAHHSEIKMEGYKTLLAGQQVRYDVHETEKGPAATNIEVIG